MPQYKVELSMTVMLRIEARSLEAARRTLLRRYENCRNYDYDDENDEILDEQEPSPFTEYNTRSGCDGIISYALTYHGTEEFLEEVPIAKDTNPYAQYAIRTASTKKYKMSNRFKTLTFCPSCGGLPTQCSCRSRNEPPWKQDEIVYEPGRRAEPRRLRFIGQNLRNATVNVQDGDAGAPIAAPTQEEQAEANALAQELADELGADITATLDGTATITTTGGDDTTWTMPAPIPAPEPENETPERGEADDGWL